MFPLFRVVPFAGYGKVFWFAGMDELVDFFRSPRRRIGNWQAYLVDASGNVMRPGSGWLPADALIDWCRDAAKNRVPPSLT